MATHRIKDTALFDKIVAAISKNGPLSLDAYISHALGDPDYGYYQTRDPFGSAGDFITAPEISGLFGEMCGLYLAHIAELSGLRDPAIFELGPGRASLIADMRHVWQHVMPSLTAAPVHLLETSFRLRRVQQDRRRRGRDRDARRHQVRGADPGQGHGPLGRRLRHHRPRGRDEGRLRQLCHRQRRAGLDGLRGLLRRLRGRARVGLRRRIDGQ